MQFQYLTQLYKLETVEEHFDFVGVSVEEIKSLEDEFGLQIPMAYKEFLLYMGHMHYPLFRGEDTMFRLLRGNQELARSLISESLSNLAFPKDALAIYSHHGYIVDFIHCGDNPDPPIFSYKQGESSFKRIEPRFTDMLNYEIERVATIPDEELARMRLFYGTGVYRTRRK